MKTIITTLHSPFASPRLRPRRSPKSGPHTDRFDHSNFIHSIAGINLTQIPDRYF